MLISSYQKVGRDYNSKEKTLIKKWLKTHKIKVVGNKDIQW